MAMIRTAEARVVTPQVSPQSWRAVRTAGAKNSKSTLSNNLIERASEIFGKEFKPQDYLLTHATIVASVDTRVPKGTKTGSLIVEGFKVNRKFADYRVTAATKNLINNNYDSFERKALLKSYGSFIGGHNWVEHNQVEALTKGRIIDAVARDIGNAIYIDILIATDKKHKDLCKAIRKGSLYTLSMGSSIVGSTCTKCGHWAENEDEMCSHISEQKGETFINDMGEEDVIAEICGHHTLPNGGVDFKEASWVETPAFTGAVLRNIVDPVALAEAKTAAILNKNPWAAKARKKAAAEEEDWDAGESEEEAPEEEPKAPEAPAEKDVFEELERDVSKYVLDSVRRNLKDKLEAKNRKSIAPATDVNDSVIRQANDGDAQKRMMREMDPAVGYRKQLEVLTDMMTGPNPLTSEDFAKIKAKNPKLWAPLEAQFKKLRRKVDEDLWAQGEGDHPDLWSGGSWGKNPRRASLYKVALEELAVKADSDADAVNKIASYNQKIGLNVPLSVYRVSVRVGGIHMYPNTLSFLKRASRHLERDLSKSEAALLVRLGKILALRGQSSE
jgi:uncharacterized protein (DUF2267 family)